MWSGLGIDGRDPSQCEKCELVYANSGRAEEDEDEDAT